MNRPRKAEAKRKRMAELRRRTEQRDDRVYRALGFGSGPSSGTRGRVKVPTFRAPPPRFVIDPVLEPQPMADAARQLTGVVATLLKSAAVTVNGVEITLYDAYTLFVPFLRHFSRLADGPAVPPQNAERDRQTCKAAEEFCTASLRRTLDELFAQNTKFDQHLCWYEAAVRADGGLQLTIGVRPPEHRTLVVDGVARRAFRCGGSWGGGGFRWFDWPPERAGDGGGKGLPLYIQQHALDRLAERLPIRPGDLSLSLLASIANPVRTRSNRDGVLIGFRVLDNYQLGHLVVRSVPGAAVVTTFLFATMQGTPEADRLRSYLKLRRPDIEYTGLDQFRTFLDCDLATDEDLARAFKACGCADLLEIRSEGRPPSTLGLAATVRKYLGIEA